jgi:hypothetical protein
MLLVTRTQGEELTLIYEIVMFKQGNNPLMSH